MSIARNTGEDLVCRSGPDEGRRVFVMDVDVIADSDFQFFHTSERPAPNPFVGKFGKPAFHQIDPGAVSGSEVDVKSRTLGEPLPDDGCFVGTVVVRDDVDIETGRHLSLDQIEEPAKLDRAMTVMELADHATGLEVQRCEQRGSPVPFVVVCAPFYLPRL